MREAIKKIVKNGGTVSVPYKKEISEWYSEKTIVEYKPEQTYLADSKVFYYIDDAVDYFCDVVYTSKNKGLIQSRLDRKGLLHTDEEYSLENPNKKLKKLFAEEGKIVDEEFKAFGVNVKKFPKLEDAKKEILLIKDFTSVDKLKKFMRDYNKKFSMLDIYISFNCNYDYEIDNDIHPYSVAGIDFEFLTKNRILELKDVSKYTDNTNMKNMKYLNFSVYFSNRNDKDDYVQFVLKI